MTYSKKELFEKAKTLIAERRCIFVEETCDFLGINKTTFYKKFPEGSNENNALKDLLQQNKSEIKNQLRLKWYKSDAPALQIALYKLNATDEEIRKMQMTAVEVSATHRILNLDPLNATGDDGAPENSGA